MILSKGQLPARARGSRILVKPIPQKEASDLIITPDAHKMMANMGYIVDAGLVALDQMRDHGDEVGDEVWFGKFAGVMEEWDHLEDVTPKGAKCEHLWVRTAAPGPRTSKWICDTCKSTRLAEHILVMNVDDILCNVSLARRIDGGKMDIRRGNAADGRTQHYIDRKADK